MLEAPITAVTVFRDGARVQRSGTVSISMVPITSCAPLPVNSV
jgi:hypothetical protein